MKSRIAVIAAVFIGLTFPAVTFAQQCPAEVAEAKSKVAAAQAALKKAPTVVQPPRTAAGYPGNTMEAPRGQDAQAPRGQDTQAPRTAVGARTADPAQAKVATASKLVTDAEQACNKGDMALSSEKARDALAALK